MRRDRLKEYRPGTFDKHIAYGQRERKLWLVARGILRGFKITCRTENEARNLAFSLRLRSQRIAADPRARFGLRVKLDGSKVSVLGKQKVQG